MSYILIVSFLFVQYCLCNYDVIDYLIASLIFIAMIILRLDLLYLLILIFLVCVLYNIIFSTHKSIKNAQKKYRLFHVVCLLISISIQLIYLVTGYKTNCFLDIISFYYMFKVIAFFTMNFITAKQLKAKYSYVIILGCGLNNAGEITPMLKYRLDKAISLFSEYQEMIYILSGGATNGKIAEAIKMKEYLLVQGVSSKSIYVDLYSYNTKDNVANCFEILKRLSLLRQKGCFISTNFHISKSKFYFRKYCIRINAIAAKCPKNYLSRILYKEFSSLLLLSF